MGVNTDEKKSDREVERKEERGKRKEERGKRKEPSNTVIHALNYSHIFKIFLPGA